MNSYDIGQRLENTLAMQIKASRTRANTTHAFFRKCEN